MSSKDVRVLSVTQQHSTQMVARLSGIMFGVVIGKPCSAKPQMGLSLDRLHEAPRTGIPMY